MKKYFLFLSIFFFLCCFLFINGYDFLQNAINILQIKQEHSINNILKEKNNEISELKKDKEQSNINMINNEFNFFLLDYEVFIKKQPFNSQTLESFYLFWEKQCHNEKILSFKITFQAKVYFECHNQNFIKKDKKIKIKNNEEDYDKNINFTYTIIKQDTTNNIIKFSCSINNFTHEVELNFNTVVVDDISINNNEYHINKIYLFNIIQYYYVIYYVTFILGLLFLILFLILFLNKNNKIITKMINLTQQSLNLDIEYLGEINKNKNLINICFDCNNYDILITGYYTSQQKYSEHKVKSFFENYLNNKNMDINSNFLYLYTSFENFYSHHATDFVFSGIIGLYDKNSMLLKLVYPRSYKIMLEREKNKLDLNNVIINEMFSSTARLISAFYTLKNNDLLEFTYKHEKIKINIKN